MIENFQSVVTLLNMLTMLFIGHGREGGKRKEDENYKYRIKREMEKLRRQKLKTGRRT